MPSTPVAFFELDLVMKISMLSEVTGLKSKAVGAGMWSVIFWMLGWFNMSSGIGTDDMSWAAFTKNSFRVLATEIWFDMILSLHCSEQVATETSVITVCYRVLHAWKCIFYTLIFPLSKLQWIGDSKEFLSEMVQNKYFESCRCAWCQCCMPVFIQFLHVFVFRDSRSLKGQVKNTAESLCLTIFTCSYYSGR